MNTLVKLSIAAIILSTTTACFPIVAASSAVVGTAIAEERSAGDKLDDNILAIKIRDMYSKAQFEELLSRISVTVYEGRVMLVGSVKEQKYVTQAIDIAWKVNGVKEVISELVVSPIGIKSYSKDTFIANTVRSKLLFGEDILSVNYKIDANNSTVYLLGIAQNQEELDKVINIARSVKGVKQVVNHVVLKDDVRRKRDAS